MAGDDFSFDEDDDNNDDEFSEDINDDEDEEEDDELDDLDNEDDDEGEEEDFDEEDEEQDDDIEAELARLSSDTDIPILLNQSEGVEEVDYERLGEEPPESISDESWAELLGREDFGFDDILEYYSEADIYEIEIGVEYGEAA